jgi:homoserine kinase
MTDTCSASAPSSTANLGPGFDIFGLALDLFEDRVKLTRRQTKGNKIIINRVVQSGPEIPIETQQNSSGLVVRKMVKDFKISDDIEIEIFKGIPSGYGLGSSAASSVATAYAFNKLFALKIDNDLLVDYAAEGEIASAGTKHYDNVASSLLGGFVVVRTSPKIEFIKIIPPEDLDIIVAIPQIRVPKKKTEAARNILPKNVSLDNVIQNISNASTVVAGFALKDVQMISKGIDDMIIEPIRKNLIPSYEIVKKYALDAGALALTISGAGPSIIAILKTDVNSEKIMSAIQDGFNESHVESKVYLCKPSHGAKII